MAEIVTQAVEEQLYEAEVTVDGRHYAYRVSVPDDLPRRPRRRQPLAGLVRDPR